MNKPIAIIHSIFKEKFSIPRQPGLISIESQIKLLAPYDREEALVGLEDFSHIWVIFSFHDIADNENSSLTVRPPRLGGNKKVGVFASRSPYRPNRLGLSLVKLERIEKNCLFISGGDFLDGTPVYDLKPYLKEVESIPDARSGWTENLEPRKLEVLFECKVENKWEAIIREVLSLDPRPSYHPEGYKEYGSLLGDFDVHWIVEQNKIVVKKIIKII